jgi:hypothetical protein
VRIYRDERYVTNNYTNKQHARSGKVEMLFAHLKRILRLDRLRLRGPSGAKDEFLLATTAYRRDELRSLLK